MIITPATNEFKNILPIFISPEYITPVFFQQIINNLREKTDFFNCTGTGLFPRRWGGDISINPATSSIVINPGIFNDDRFFSTTESSVNYNIARIACLHDPVTLDFSSIKTANNIIVIKASYNLIQDPVSATTMLIPTVTFSVVPLSDPISGNDSIIALYRINEDMTVLYPVTEIDLVSSNANSISSVYKYVCQFENSIKSINITLVNSTPTTPVRITDYKEKNVNILVSNLTSNNAIFLDNNNLTEDVFASVYQYYNKTDQTTWIKVTTGNATSGVYDYQYPIAPNSLKRFKIIGKIGFDNVYTLDIKDV